MAWSTGDASGDASGDALALAVDVGGTHLRAACVTRDGDVVGRRRTKTPGRGEPETVIPAVVALVEEARSEAAGRSIVGIGVAAPGPLDPATGVVFGVPNMAGWHDVPLAGILADALGLPVHLHNDANLAGLGEARFGAGRGFDPLVYLTVSTGIGGGIILGGRMYAGAHGLAGELGHTIVHDGGPACNFQHRGCLEALASGTGIARQAGARMAAGETSHIPSYCDADGIVTARAVAMAADAGDALARSIFEEAGWALGVGIGSLVNALDPARVVVGGGVSQSWHLFGAEMIRGVRSIAMVWEERPIEIVPAALGDNAGLAGAGAYAFDCACPIGDTDRPLALSPASG